MCYIRFAGVKEIPQKSILFSCKIMPVCGNPVVFPLNAIAHKPDLFFCFVVPCAELGNSIIEDNTAEGDLVGYDYLFCCLFFNPADKVKALFFATHRSFCGPDIPGQ